MLLDELMPRYEFGGAHRIEVFAPPERALEAVKQVTPDEMPIARLLFALRSLPAHLVGKDGLPADKTVALYDHMARRFVLLAEQPGQEILVGRIGELWKLVGGMSPAFRDADGFAEFGEPGYAKVAASFSAVSRDGLTELCTETRVLTTDPTSRRAFERYWRVIQPWSGVIRRSWLRAAKRRAESDTCAAVEVESESDEKPRANGGLWVARSILPWVSVGAGAAKLIFLKDRLQAPMPWIEDFRHRRGRSPAHHGRSSEAHASRGDGKLSYVRHIQSDRGARGASRGRSRP